MRRNTSRFKDGIARYPWTKALVGAMDNAEPERGEFLNPACLLDRIANRALRLIPAADGVLIGLGDESRMIYVSGAGSLAPHVGRSVEGPAGLADLAATTRPAVNGCGVENDRRIDLDTCHDMQVASCLCVPVRRGDQVLGVIELGSGRPDAFVTDDADLLESMADLMSIVVGPLVDPTRSEDFSSPNRGPDLRLNAEESSSLRHALDDSGNCAARDRTGPDPSGCTTSRHRLQTLVEGLDVITTLFQPIIHIESRSIVGVEALARFDVDPPRAPNLWFADAHSVGLGIEMETFAAAKALTHLPTLPVEWDLTLNVGPEAVVSSAFTDLLAGVDPHRVVIELTEHSRVLDYPRLIATLQMLRQTGVRVAIDDVGAGFSGLSHLLKLAPDFIKLDRDLVARINVDPVRRALGAALVSFAADTGAEIIAEGIETEEELEALEDLGVRYAQGYLVGLPTSIAALLWFHSERVSATPSPFSVRTVPLRLLKSP